MGRWDTEITDECVVWYRGLTGHEATVVDAAIEKPEELGPALGRPFVDHLETDLLSNLKELRSGPNGHAALGIGTRWTRSSG